jgi:hypothetical protein
MVGILLGDRVAAIAAAIEFLPGEADFMAAVARSRKSGASLRVLKRR